MDIFLPSLRLSFSSSKDIQLKPFASKYFTTPIVQNNHFFHCCYTNHAFSHKDNNLRLVLSGHSTDEETMPYNWEIFKDIENSTKVIIRVRFLKDKELKEATALIDTKLKSLKIYIASKSQSIIKIDPLFHPLGSLTMVYLSHYTGGFMIHASGVFDKKSGFLFTAISGTGKTTMAKLWEKSGTTIINDDRLWIQKYNEKWYMFNTPMVWYAQEPLMAPIDKIFLIRQSPINQLKQLTGLNASMKVMSNCIQHFYDKDMTTNHIDRVLNMTSQVPMFDCGFKPDNEIVELIKLLGK